MDKYRSVVACLPCSPVGLSHEASLSYLSWIVLDVPVARLLAFLSNLTPCINPYASIHFSPLFEAPTPVTFNIVSRGTLNLIPPSHTFHQKRNMCLPSFRA
jgi:hypothetical protein